MENDNLSKIRDLMLARVRGQGGTLGTLLNQWQGKQFNEDRSVMDSYQPPVPQTGYVNTEEPLGPPSLLGGLLSLDPTDYVGPNTLAKLAAGAKGLLSGAALMPMAGSMKGSGVNSINWANAPRETFIQEVMDMPVYHAAYKGQRADFVDMTPDEYLRYANQYTGSSLLEKEKLDSLRKGISEGKELGLPYLSFNDVGKVTAQEGRHRAAVAKELGQEKIRVGVFNQSKDRDYDLERAWKRGEISLEEAMEKLGLTKPPRYPAK